jgi:Resolvase, N terminal domain
MSARRVRPAEAGDGVPWWPGDGTAHRPWSWWRTWSRRRCGQEVAGVNGESKITASHRARLALVYLRQSTMLQVRDHTESTVRQYALAELAAALGWPAENIVVIDTDLGTSGRFGTQRGGFCELVAKVCLGEAGGVFGLEVSRLARSSADIARLLELARLTDTLVIDTDGVYDLTDLGDRLLLGLKGSMSEVLCRDRHKTSYADIAVMPTMRRERAVVRVGGRECSA